MAELPSVSTSVEDLHWNNERHRTRADKMADLEAIHREIAPQVNAMRIALNGTMEKARGAIPELTARRLAQ